MNYLMRFLIALPIISYLSISSGISIAAIPSTSHKSSAETTLTLAGFLDFKSLLFSSGTGDDLDGVFNQIKIIGPETFRNAALRHGILKNFKSKRSPVFSTNPIWQWNDSDLDVLNVEVYGKPSAASMELIDAILGDVTDNTRNHGVSWMLNPAVGPATAAYFNSATQRVMGLIEELENTTATVPAMSQTTHATQPVAKIPHLALLFFSGLVLVTIGLLWPRLRKTLPRPVKRADPVACFDAIRNSPIRYEAKTL